MMINLQNKMAFGYNPYNDRAECRKLSDEEVGRQLLDYAYDYCWQIRKKTATTINDPDTLTWGDKAILFGRIAEDNSAKAREIKAEIGAKIRTCA